MKFDIKNILIGIIVGIFITLVVVFLLNDVYVDIQVGNIKETINKNDLMK